jgi:hypothetical protein
MSFSPIAIYIKCTFLCWIQSTVKQRFGELLSLLIYSLLSGTTLDAYGTLKDIE